jgi:hypothetical protein
MTTERYRVVIEVPDSEGLIPGWHAIPRAPDGEEISEWLLERLPVGVEVTVSKEAAK